MDILWKHHLTAAALVAVVALTPLPVNASIVMQGHSGGHVEELQSHLNRLGFLSENPDGMFGPATKVAVQAFQKVESLPADGVVGPETLAALEHSVEKAESSSEAPEPRQPIDFSEHELLRRGARNSSVTVLQEALVTLGHLEAQPNGVFGPQTERAVKAFQNSAGTSADGIVGQTTWSALATALEGQRPSPVEIVAVSVRSESQTLQTVEESGTESVAFEPSEQALVRRGDRSASVQRLQELLVALGHLDAEPNGVFGPQTETAVKAFQRSVGERADGMAGQQTWTALASAVESALTETTVTAAEPSVVPEATAATVSPEGSLVRRGQRGETVRQLQTVLVELGLLQATPNGVFGPQTETAVRQAQAWLGLRADGIAGPATWAALNERLQVLQQEQKALAALPTLNETVRQGDRGEQVSMIQERLIALNFLQGSVDGVFGPGTRQAVQSFQRSAGLTPDGVMGQKTWEALAASRPGQYIPVVVEDMHWRDVQRIFAVGDVVTLEDVETGLTWRVKRLYGSNHADIEPLTAADTAVMRQVYGGSWSWERRAVIVKIGDRLVAASINGFPHGGSNIRNNNFPGHVCMHFRGSQLHVTGRSDPDHQAMIQRSKQATPSSIQVR